MSDAVSMLLANEESQVSQQRSHEEVEISAIKLGRSKPSQPLRRDPLLYTFGA